MSEPRRGAALLGPTDDFAPRHLGPDETDVASMLEVVGARSLEALVAETVPAGIRLSSPQGLPVARGERDALLALRGMAGKNQVLRSFLGLGYHDCVTPPVIQRNVLENPGWYTQYTPYQPEIAQGRLEALLNFQTMVADLTGLPLANASLLDEATAAAEAMHMAHAVDKTGRRGFFVAEDCHPQTLAVVRTRAKPLGIRVHVGRPEQADFAGQELFGLLVQYPTSDGRIED
ncbi:MAG TPA: glycine dehydrogenase (aminomethyl-transferring), partial [Vicinamibacteria bacterium]